MEAKAKKQHQFGFLADKYWSRAWLVSACRCTEGFLPAKVRACEAPEHTKNAEDAKRLEPGAAGCTQKAPRRTGTCSSRILTATAVFSYLLLCGLWLSAWSEEPSAAPAQSGPVDIQANEQEFSGDQVLAHGNVKVTYRDTVIIGPDATLSRNATGSPQSAVFTGHPHLVQNGVLMDSDTLMFDIANHAIAAEGHAHSEVVSSEGGNGGAKPPAPASGSAVATAASGGSTTSGAATVATTSDAADADKKKPVATVPGTGQAAATGGGTEKIITDSDRQEYDQNSDKFIALGHVHVKHADIKVSSDKLQLVYGADKKPETAIFTGRAIANQGKNITRADVVTYNLATRRLQATGHVRSKVIQEKSEADSSTPQKVATRPAVPAAIVSDAAPADSDKLKGGVSANEEEVYILSDSQDYNKQTGQVCAEGNVKVYYEDSVGLGPRATLIRGENGKAEKIVFTGRSQVNQPHKWWIGDQITLMMANKHVVTQGNTKAYIERTPVSELKKKKDQDNNHSNDRENSQLASRSRASQELSAARIEAAQ